MISGHSHCHAMRSRAVPRHTVPCRATPCHAAPRRVAPCHAMPCHAVLCHAIAMLCCAKLSRVVPSRATPRLRRAVCHPRHGMHCIALPRVSHTMLCAVVAGPCRHAAVRCAAPCQATPFQVRPGHGMPGQAGQCRVTCPAQLCRHTAITTPLCLASPRLALPHVALLPRPLPTTPQVWPSGSCRKMT